MKLIANICNILLPRNAIIRNLNRTYATLLSLYKSDTAYVTFKYHPLTLLFIRNKITNILETMVHLPGCSSQVCSHCKRPDVPHIRTHPSNCANPVAHKTRMADCRPMVRIQQPPTSNPSQTEKTL